MKHYRAYVHWLIVDGKVICQVMFLLTYNSLMLYSLDDSCSWLFVLPFIYKGMAFTSVHSKETIPCPPDIFLHQTLA